MGRTKTLYIFALLQLSERVQRASFGGEREILERLVLSPNGIIFGLCDRK